MPLTISFVSQKGGVGKSTLARALAVALRQAGMNVVVADLDGQQGTVAEWAKLRTARRITPSIVVRSFKTADDAIIAGGAADVLIVDAPARTSAGTLELARQSDLVVQPSGCGLDISGRRFFSSMNWSRQESAANAWWSPSVGQGARPRKEPHVATCKRRSTRF
jgi:MinD-like ATPase involved in chromosome partitioning or flagellar assembly